MMTTENLQRYLKSLDLPYGDEILELFMQTVEAQKDIVSELLHLRDLNRWRDARPWSGELPEEGQEVETLRMITYYDTHGQHTRPLIIIRTYRCNDTRWNMTGSGMYRWWRPMFDLPPQDGGDHE